MQIGRIGVGIIPRQQVLFGNLAGQKRPETLQMLLPAPEKDQLLINSIQKIGYIAFTGMAEPCFKGNKYA